MFTTITKGALEGAHYYIHTYTTHTHTTYICDSSTRMCEKERERENEDRSFARSFLVLVVKERTLITL